jgi:tetratricopeptide (TPR) repeat protein
MKTKKIMLACLLTLCLSFALSAWAGGGGQVYYDLGVFAFDEDNFVDAEKHFTAAIEQEPDNSYYQHFLGKTYLKTKRPEDAIIPLEAAWKLNPDISSLQFDLATAYYEVSNYKEAAKLFSGIVAQDPDNVLARYYLGMSYFKQDKYGQALNPLLQAGDENESIRENSYYFAGISHFKFDEPDKALEKLKYVETKGTSEKLRHSARQWQEVIKEQQTRSAPYNLYLELGLVYDDNVNLAVDENIFTGEEDFAATFYFSGKYKFVNTLNRKLGVGYSHYQSFYQDLSEFDLTAAMPSLFYQERVSSELYLSFNYLPTHYWVDGDHYLRRNQLSPSLMYRLDNSKGLRLAYDFRKDDYFDDVLNRSGNGNIFKVDFITMLFNKNGDLTVGALYENQGASNPDYEYELLRAHFDFSYALPREWKLVVKGIFYRKDYDNNDSMAGYQREDDRISVGLELSRPVFYKWLLVQAKYYHTNNDSNINSYSYKKNVAGLSLITKF